MTSFEPFSEFLHFVRQLYSTDDFIPLHEPRFRGNEQKYVLDAIESTYVSSVGEYVNDFENRIAKFTGARYAIATNNGTSALHTALFLAEVNNGDEVITQPLTFVATCNAIRYCGADPVFVDIEPNTLGLSPDSLAMFLEKHAEVRDDGLCWNRISKRIIRACVPVHTLGHPARVEGIQEICTQYNIWLIEDASESLGSFRSGVHTGRTGCMGVISFNGNKIITTGGGGAIITDDENLAERGRSITTTAKRPHSWLFGHDELGFNYRLPNLNAALGCAQMEQLPSFIAWKRQLADCYREWYENREGEFFLEPSGACSNYWLNAVLLRNKEERDSFLEYTNSQRVMTRPMWTLMTELPMYVNCYKTDLVNAKEISERVVNVPSSVV